MSDEKVDVQVVKEALQEKYLEEMNTTTSVEERNRIALSYSGFASFIKKYKDQIKITFGG